MKLNRKRKVSIWLRACGLASLALLSSCAWISKPTQPKDLSIDSIAATPQAPYELNILNQYNVDGLLHIFGEVRTLASNNISDADIEVREFDNGVVLAEKRINLADAASGIEKPEPDAPQKFTKIPFHVAIPVMTAKDFEVTLVWGADRQVQRANVPAPQGPQAQVSNVRILHDRFGCPDACRERLALLFDLKNTGNSDLISAQIGVGYVQQRSRLALVDEIPQNEQRIELNGLKLSPGASQAVKFNFERVFEPGELEGVRPQIRVLEVH